MDALAFLAHLQGQPRYRGQIAALRVLEPREPHYRQPATPLPDRLQVLLAGDGITQLYSHQADAYDAIHTGRDVVIATGTASGKSLCYHLPVLAALLEEPEARALYLFPAKALAHDQLGNLQRLVTAADLADVARPACYDGDTPTHQRAAIRRSATILLSNPDMLHQGILPYNPKWASFLANLRYVVLDEIHTYRGIFGSHVAGVISRLQRVCRHYGSDPQFICCSATLGNPRELAQRLTTREMTLIDHDGSPRGRRYVALWNPPLIDHTAATGEKGDRRRGAAEVPVPLFAPKTTARAIFRRSGNAEATDLMRQLVEAGAGTITFTKARVVAELIYTYVTDALRRRRPDLAKRVRPYRGGYLPNERREIERQLFSGELLGVCSTTALELGIDVGALDAAIIVGFPGTLCSLWQQAGRAGRRRDESLTIFVAYDDPVDQYLMRNPEFVFDQPLEHAIIDPENPHILAAQLGCAAAELPLTDSDLATFTPLPRSGKRGLAPRRSRGACPHLPRSDRPPNRSGRPPSRPSNDNPDNQTEQPTSFAAEIANLLVDDGRLRLAGGRYHWASAEFAAAQTNLRTISNATFAIVDQTDGCNEVIGQVDSISAPELVYPEAVYIHQGESYLVRELDLPARLAHVQRLEADYYTQPVLADECRITAEHLAGDCLSGRRFFGDVSVRWQTTAFRKFKLHSQELIGQTTLDLPSQQIDTVAVWFQPPNHARRATRDAGHELYEALAGVRNLIMVALPPLAMCDRYDIGGVVNSSQLGVATIIVYDRYEGGVGYARHAFEHSTDLLKLAFDLVSGCKCDAGCPACVAPPNLRIPIHQDPDVGSGYAIPDKHATLTLLRAWLP